MSEQRCVITLHKGNNKADIMQEMQDAGFTIHNEKVGSLRNFDILATPEQAADLRNDDRIIDVRVGSKQDNGHKLSHSAERYGHLQLGTTVVSNTPYDWAKEVCQTGKTPYSTSNGYVGLTGGGKDVDIVILDSGIELGHPEWEDHDTGVSRLQQIDWPSAAGLSGSYTQGAQHYTDQYGHGTHCAGTAAGCTYGWAPKANIYALKIFDTDKFGVNTAFILIRNWHINKGNDNPTIVSMSFAYLSWYLSITGGEYRGTPWTGTTINNTYGMIDESFDSNVGAYIHPVRNASVDAEVEDCLDAGIIMVAGAGNDYHKFDAPGGADYDNFFTSPAYADSTRYYHRGPTPAAVPGVIAVGAGTFGPPNFGLTEWDTLQVTNFSNVGPGVDLIAPGNLITSALPDNSTIYNSIVNNDRAGSYWRDPNFKIGSISGTSMACPQVTGVIAMLAEARRKWTQDQWRDYLNQSSWQGVIDTYSDDTDYTDFGSLLGGPNRWLRSPFTDARSFQMYDADLGEPTNTEFVLTDERYLVNAKEITEGEDILLTHIASSTQSVHVAVFEIDVGEVNDTVKNYRSGDSYTFSSDPFIVQSSTNWPHDRYGGPRYTGKLQKWTQTIKTINSGGALGTRYLTIYPDVTSFTNRIFYPDPIIVKINPSNTAPPTVNQTFTLIYEGPNPVDEGTNQFFTLNTTNVEDGTVVPLRYLNADSTEFNTREYDFYFRVFNNTAQVRINFDSDFTTEGTQVIDFYVDGGNTISVTVNDTSVDLVLAYNRLNNGGRSTNANVLLFSESGYPDAVGSNQQLVTSLFSRHVPVGTTINYTITEESGKNYDLSNVIDVPLTGQLTVTEVADSQNESLQNTYFRANILDTTNVPGAKVKLTIDTVDSLGNSLGFNDPEDYEAVWYLWDNSSTQYNMHISYTNTSGSSTMISPDRYDATASNRYKALFVGDTATISVNAAATYYVGTFYTRRHPGNIATLTNGESIILNPSEPTIYYVWYENSTPVAKIQFFAPGLAETTDARVVFDGNRR